MRYAGLIDLRLRFELWDRPELCDPWLSGAGPPLRMRDDLVALTNGPQADGINLRARSGGARVDMRSTLGAKRLRPLVSALGSLDVDFRVAGKQPESVFARKGMHAERGPENVWQSVQLQSRVLSSSISASKVTYPQ